MENHLYEKHRYDILKKLQVGYLDIEDRIQYAMDLIKQRSEAETDGANDNNVDESSTTNSTKENDKE